MFFKFIKQFGKVLLILTALFVLAFYLNFLFRPYCLKLGYTLCAAIGEDFFALYQATYNFFHNIFIYGEYANLNLVTPYFMPFKYFPISPLVIGWPFLITSLNVEIAYKFYLWFVIAFYCLGFWGIYLMAKKFKTDGLTKILAFFLWFTFFPILSDLRMGQYNLISSLFFLFSLVFLVYSKNILSAFSWIISLAFKPISLLNIIYYLKARNKIAIWGFIICFVIFTGGYLLYYQLYYPSAIGDFIRTIFISGNRVGWEIHYPDNFSLNTFLGELFYDKSKILFSLISKLYVVLLFLVFLVISLKIKLRREVKTDLYYSLYAFATMIMYHKEVWESWLSCWVAIVAILLILADNYREKIFVFLNGLILGTPSLFYFYELNRSNLWRLLLISEKAVPQLLIYGYLIYRLCVLIREQSTGLNPQL
jgi:hypothetical protein